MRIAGQLHAAIEVLQENQQRNIPLAIALRDWGRAHRFAGAKDRAIIGNIAYDTLRRRSFFAWKMQSDNIADCAFYSLIFEGEYKLPDLLAQFAEDPRAFYRPSDQQIKLLQNDLNFAAAKQEQPGEKASAAKHAGQPAQPKELTGPPFMLANIPAPALAYFQHAFGDNWLSEAMALSERPSLDLRVNYIKSHPGKVLRHLGHIKHIEQISWFPHALRIAPIKGPRRHPNVEIEAAFQKGGFEIQDLGSQIIAYLAFFAAKEPKTAPQILDYCAGAGGKSLAIASWLRNKGQIHCYDKDKARLAPIYARLKRANVHNCQIYNSQQQLQSLRQKMDLVICDVPCSGSGVWRRHPDSKWRFRPEQLEKRCLEQRLILDDAPQYLKVGGLLAYMTCSLFREENDEQIATFLQKNPNYQVLAPAGLWNAALGFKAPKPLFSKYGLLLTPANINSDGFYLSMLKCMA